MHLWFFAFLSFIVNIVSKYLCMFILFCFSENVFHQQIILVKNELTGENYLDWKRNLFNILTAKGSKYVLTQPCPPEPSLYDYRNQREPYEKWCEANKMAKRYILASISVELHKKHRSMETTTEIMASLH